MPVVNNNSLVPQPQQLFLEASENLVEDEDMSISEFAEEHGVSLPFAAEQQQIGQRFRTLLRSGYLESIRFGVPPQLQQALQSWHTVAQQGGFSPEEALRIRTTAYQRLVAYLNGSQFLGGFNALVLQDPTLHISRERGRELRDTVASLLLAYPGGQSEPGFLQEAYLDIRNTYFTNLLQSRSTPPRVFVDIVEDQGLRFLDQVIDHLSTQGGHANTLRQLRDARTEIQNHLLCLQTPGFRALLDMPQVITRLSELRTAVSNLEDDDAPAVASELASILTQLNNLRQTEPIPGSPMTAVIDRMNTLLVRANTIVSELETDDVEQPLAAFSQQLTTWRGTAARSLDAYRNMFGNPEAPGITASPGLPQTILTRLTQLRDAMPAGYARNRMNDAVLRVTGGVQILNQAQSMNAAELADELRYIRLLLSYYEACSGFELADSQPVLSLALTGLSNMSSLLEQIDSEAFDGLRSNLQTFTAQVNQLGREGLEEAGFNVNGMPYSYALQLGTWQGQSPIGQAAMDRLNAHLTVAIRLQRTQQQFYADLVEIYENADEQELEGQEREDFINQQARSLYSATWQEIHALRQEVFTAAHGSVQRALTQGIPHCVRLHFDGFAPLNEQQRRAFALAALFHQRRDAALIAQYQNQQTLVRQPGVALIPPPASMIIAESLPWDEMAEIGEYSDEELQREIAQCGEAYTTALAMYEHLTSELTAQNPDNEHIGLCNLISVLDSVGARAYQTLSSGRSFHNVLDAVGEGAQRTYQPNLRYSILEGEWAAMQQDITALITDNLNISSLEAFRQAAETYWQENASHVSTANGRLLNSRLTRLYDFARTFFSFAQIESQ